MVLCLSKLAEVQLELFGKRNDGWRVHGVVEPVRKIAVGKEIHAQHRGEHGKGPRRLGEMMKPFQQQQGDEGCPNLDAQGVFADADEAFDLQVLFERLEKQFDLPAFAVDLGHRRGPEFEMVGEQHDFPFLLGVPHHHAAQRMRAFGWGAGAGEADDFVGQDVAVARNGPPFDDLVDGVVFHAGDEEDALGDPRGELLVVVVGAVHDDDRPAASRSRCRIFESWRLASVIRTNEGM